MSALHALDYWVLAAYLAIVVLVCVRVTRRSPDAEDLFLAGRSLGPGVVGLSLFASNISSTTLIGLPGAAWEHGIAVANYEWMASLMLVIAALFVIPVFLGSRISTIPELLERRFDSRMRKYLAGTTVFLAMVLDVAGSLYAGGLVLTLLIPALNLDATIAIIAVFVGLYTAAGGFRAVAYTDVLQAIILLGGSIMLSALVFAEFDFSWSRVVAAVPADHLSLIRPIGDPGLSWLGTLIGLPIFGFYYWIMNQELSQRVLSARDVRAAGYGAMIAAALKLLPLFLMVLPGAMAIALFDDLPRADLVYPRLIAEFAPVGVAGLILAGLLSAIMSSIDSSLNSASTLITLDFVRPRRPQLDTRQMARFGRIITVVLVVLAALWAPAIDDFPGLFAYLQQTFAYVTPPLVAVFVLGFLWRAFGADAAFRATLTGHAASAAWFVAAQLGWIDLHFTLMAGVLFVVTLVAAFAWQARLAMPAGAVQLAAVDRRRAPAVPAGVRWCALAVTAATLALVVAFR